MFEGSRAVLVGLLAAGTLVFGASPASGTFPGRNGRILVEGPLAAPKLRSWTILPDGRGARPVRRLPGPAAWSPDGRRLLFTHPCPPRSGCGGNDFTPGPNELDTVDPRGGHLRRIRFRSPHGIVLPGAHGPELMSGGPYEASWSRDGKRLVFARVVPEEAGDGAIFTSRADGRGQRLLVDSYRDFGHVETFTSPSFSPGGSAIAFVASNAYVMASNGTAIRPLSGCPVPLAVLGCSGQSPSGCPVPLVVLGCSVQSLDWAPDGRRLALAVSSPPFQTEHVFVVVVNADGSGERVLRPGSRPFWSPDGTKLGSILLAPDRRTGALQISNADGSGLRTVRRHVTFAVWQPLPRRRR